MSPAPPSVRVIRCVAPRHNAQRPGLALAQTIDKVARVQKKKKKNVRVDVRNGYPRRVSSEGNPLAAAIESASEWNSLLLTARAERGPQWDVATQQFVVDEGSELYYDPSPLRQSEPEKPDPSKDAQRGRSSSALPGHVGGLPMHAPPGMHRQPSMNSPHPGPQHFDPRFGGPPPGMGGFHPNPAMHAGPPSHVSPSQFYGGPGHMAPQAPQMRDGMDPMAFSPMHDQRRMTRQMSMGMGDGFVPQGMYGN